ncbi:MAG TPA: hypothetical protein VJG90_02225, partial [Candidatus Nanoarchaeia archaeon]|nr:hypothetical protein [Candidatus Nanoarchaeia archaeon]
KSLTAIRRTFKLYASHLHLTSSEEQEGIWSCGLVRSNDYYKSRSVLSIIAAVIYLVKKGTNPIRIRELASYFNMRRREINRTIKAIKPLIKQNGGERRQVMRPIQVNYA